MGGPSVNILSWAAGGLCTVCWGSEAKWTAKEQRATKTSQMLLKRLHFQLWMTRGDVWQNGLHRHKMGRIIPGGVA